MKTHRKPTLSGFTLVELLVVILIISILLTIGSVALKGAGGKGVSTAVATTEALFDEARSVAIGKGSRACVLINADPESEGYLRQIVIVSEVLDASGEPSNPNPDATPAQRQWELSARGYTMPDKVYFSKEFSRKNHEAGSGEIDTFELSGGKVSAAYEGRYFYYEFNSEGICLTGLGANGDYSGPSFVVGSGVLSAGGDRPRTSGDARRDFKGFVIWRNGSTSIFREPGQIVGNQEPTTF